MYYSLFDYPKDETGLVKTIDVLGTEYKIKIKSEKEYEKLQICSSSGLAELYSKEIVLKDLDNSSDSYANLLGFKKEVARHEIIHAFLFEAGNVDYDSERLVHCLSVLIPKISKVFKDLNI